MQFQERLFSCGPAAVRAALYVLGRSVTEATIRKYARTTPQGTDEKGIIRAIRHYGHTTKEYHSESRKQAWNWLKSTLGRGKPVLLCVDEWDHWVVAVGRLGGHVLVFDPLPEKGRRKQYSGLKMYNEHDLSTRWRYYDEETERSSYYAIAVR